MPGHGEGPLPGLAEATASIELHSRRHRIWRKLRLVVLGAGLLLLLAELGLRFSWQPPVDPLAGDAPILHELAANAFFQALPESEGRYGLRPGAQAAIDGVEYRISEQGTRGSDFPSAKPAGEKRLLVLGSGRALGLGIPLEATAAEILAALASTAAGPASPWRGINLGVPGYGFPQQASDLQQRGLNFEPDLVLAYFHGEQVVDSGYFLDTRGQLQRDRIPLPRGLRALLWKSQLYAYLAATYRHSQEMNSNAPKPMDADWVRGISAAQSQAGLERIEAICLEAGVPFRRLDAGKSLHSSYAELQSEGLLP